MNPIDANTCDESHLRSAAGGTVAMTLCELIESLQDLADELGEGKAAETEVRLAIQPRWAFEHSIAGVALSTDIERDGDEEKPVVVYLAEGRQLGYAPGGIWEVAR